MKIAVITDSIREESTGIGFYAKEVILELIKNDKKNEYFYVDYLKTSFNQENFVYIDQPFPYYKNTLWHAVLPYRIRDYNFDVILNFSACPHFLSYRQKEIFFVYDISWYLYPEYHPKSRVRFYKAFFKKTLRDSSKIIVDSISTKTDLINVFETPEQKIDIIYPPFTDTVKDIKKIAYDLSFPYILSIGTLEPRKNVASIITAFKALKDKKKIPHKLVICGKKGWMYDDIFALIKKFKLEKEIIYLGYITNEEKKYLYKHADCFIFPSFYEGFGIPVQEAMSYGCPVITSSISSLPEVVGKAGLLVNPHDVEELAEAMEKVIFDKKLRAKMKEEGFVQVKKLSNEKQIKKLLTVINTL